MQSLYDGADMPLLIEQEAGWCRTRKALADTTPDA
jgi:hypothetical protein